MGEDSDSGDAGDSSDESDDSDDSDDSIDTNDSDDLAPTPAPSFTVIGTVTAPPFTPAPTAPPAPTPPPSPIAPPTSPVVGGGGVPSPSSSSTPPPCPPNGAPADLTKAIATDTFAQAMAQAVAANFSGMPISINTTAPLPPGAAASAVVAMGAIDWSSANITQAIAPSTTSPFHFQQQENQIFTHEALHLWYETTPFGATSNPNPLPGQPNFNASATVVLNDGTILTYNLAPIPGAASGDLPSLNPGFFGYEHALIHDDLVTNYGSDGTDAGAEMLQNATSVQFAGNTTAMPVTPTTFSTMQAEMLIAQHNLGSVGIQSGRNGPKPPPKPISAGGCMPFVAGGDSVSRSSLRVRGNGVVHPAIIIMKPLPNPTIRPTLAPTARPSTPVPTAAPTPVPTAIPTPLGQYTINGFTATWLGDQVI
jgi:hypothetical protein